MNLRCRPGDLAIIVRTQSADRRWEIGRIVRLSHLAPADRFAEGPAWLLAERLVGPDGSLYGYVLDEILRPIRPDAEPVDVERDEPVEALA